MTVDKLRIVSLDALKRQMKIDFEEEDDLIVMYGVAAEDAIINATRRSYEELVMENRKRKSDEKRRVSANVVYRHPDDGAQLYKNREPVSSLSQAVVPYTFDYMLKPWIKLEP